MPDLEDQFKPIAYEYGKVESDKEKSRYELEVNWPSILTMLPKPPAKVLDYGCGSGVYTRLLLEGGYDVLGVDNAIDMISQMNDIAAKAKVWTYQNERLPNTFDAIVAKLVVQFVEDLNAFGISMRKQLNPQGCLIISIPHPNRSRKLAGGESTYRTEVGTSGLMVTMIHRELDEIIEILGKSGFQLEDRAEPLDPEAHDDVPKRLNMLFRLAG